MLGACRLNNKSMRVIRREAAYQAIAIDLTMLGVISKEECEMLIGCGIPKGLVLPNGSVGNLVSEKDLPEQPVETDSEETSYVYNYKPEAVNVDPRIDPNEEHIGPMAQDIEQVNPACVKETSDGVKTVDTARLAMMNAGAIGDLARQLDELNRKFQTLGL